MKINQNTTLLSFQYAFKENFPGLDIHFYSKEHDFLVGSFNHDELTEDIKIANFNNDIGEFDFEFDKNELTGDFEKRVKEKLGLNVQVLRKSGKIYIQTTNTDTWTLAKQVEESHD